MVLYRKDKGMYVLITKTLGEPVVMALTDNSDVIKWWRRKDVNNTAVRREVINTREEWIKFFDPSWYDSWIKAGIK